MIPFVHLIGGSEPVFVDAQQSVVTVSGDLVRLPLDVTFSPRSMRTYYLTDDSNTWKEVLITEYDM